MDWRAAAEACGTDVGFARGDEDHLNAKPADTNTARQCGRFVQFLILLFKALQHRVEAALAICEPCARACIGRTAGERGAKLIARLVPLLQASEALPLCDVAVSFLPGSGDAVGALNLLQFPTWNHSCEITMGVRLEECREMLKSFFAEQRAAKKNGEP